MQTQHEATITVAEKGLSSSGKTYRLVTDAGESFSVFPADQQYYQVGQRYTVGYTSSDFQGRTYHTIKGAPKGGASGPPMPAAGAGKPVHYIPTSQVSDAEYDL